MRGERVWELALDQLAWLVVEGSSSEDRRGDSEEARHLAAQRVSSCRKVFFTATAMVIVRLSYGEIGRAHV